jgi:uncharacterized protein with GYD domain
MNRHAAVVSTMALQNCIDSIERPKNHPAILQECRSGVDEFGLEFSQQQLTFGYMSYDVVRYFEDSQLQKKRGDLEIPKLPGRHQM